MRRGVILSSSHSRDFTQGVHGVRGSQAASRALQNAEARGTDTVDLAMDPMIAVDEQKK
jgi:hypothetical protein